MSPDFVLDPAGLRQRLEELPPASDLLSRLHTLRSFATDVKAQADTSGFYRVATLCAQCAENVTQAIDLHNQRTTANEQTPRAG